MSRGKHHASKTGAHNLMVILVKKMNIQAYTLHDPNVFSSSHTYICDISTQAGKNLELKIQTFLRLFRAKHIPNFGQASHLLFAQ